MRYFGFPRCRVPSIPYSRCEASGFFGSCDCWSLESLNFRGLGFPRLQSFRRSDLRCCVPETQGARDCGLPRLGASDVWVFETKCSRDSGLPRFETSGSLDTDVFWGSRDLLDIRYTHMHARHHGEMLAMTSQIGVRPRTAKPRVGCPPSASRVVA